MSILASIRQNAMGLGLFAVLTAGVIAITQLVTAPRISENERQYQAKLLFDILPLANETMLNTPRSLAQFSDVALLGTDQDAEYFMDADTGDIILPVVAPDGYTESIRMLVGISRDGTVTGVRVVTHKETPGLGDRIELKKSPWILQFDGVSLFAPVEEQWAVAKDGGAFDQMSGATITPRAIVSAVHHSLLFYRNHQAALLGETE